MSLFFWSETQSLMASGLTWAASPLPLPRIYAVITSAILFFKAVKLFYEPI